MKFLLKKKIKLIILSIYNLFNNKSVIEYQYIDYKRKYIIHNTNKERLGILVQGPYNNVFPCTKDIINYYKKISNVDIVYSCHNINNYDYKVLKNLNIHIVNINHDVDERWKYQFENTLEGLQLLKDNGYENVFKTRSDQILLNLNFPTIFKQRMNLSNKLGDANDNRIIFSSLGSFYRRQFSFSDMLQYSHVDNLISYWQSDGIHKYVFKGENLSLKWHEWRTVEGNLSKNYCIRCLGKEDLRSYEKQLVGIVNREEIDQVWQKYRITSNQYIFDNTYNNQYTFSYWLNRIMG